MPTPGEIVLFNFPQTNLAFGKLRPALLLGKLPGPYDDWLLYPPGGLAQPALKIELQVSSRERR